MMTVCKEKINKQTQERKVERKEKWGRETNNGKSKTFVISHFFVRSLDTTFAVLINTAFLGAN
jgi:hypothetical protein